MNVGNTLSDENPSSALDWGWEIVPEEGQDQLTIKLIQQIAISEHLMLAKGERYLTPMQPYGLLSQMYRKLCMRVK